VQLNSTVIVIQARMGSSRLPGKVLMDVFGKPLLQLQIELLSAFHLNAKIIVATSSLENDLPIQDLCTKIGVECFRGSENNVFSRYRSIAASSEVSNLIRLTGDNPLIEYPLLKGILDQHNHSKADFTSTRYIYPDKRIERYVAKGKSIDIFSRKLILSIPEAELDDFDKEHVIPSMYRYCENFNPFRMSSFNKDSISVDELSDYDRLISFISNFNTFDEIVKYCGYKS